MGGKVNPPPMPPRRKNVSEPAKAKPKAKKPAKKPEPKEPRDEPKKPAARIFRDAEKMLKTGIAPTLPHATTGTINALPESLRNEAKALMEAGSVADGRENIAVVQALLVREMAQIADSRPLWNQLQALIDLAAMRGKTYIQISAIDKIVESGAAASARTTSVMRMAKDVASLRKTEVEIVSQVRDMLSAQEVAELRKLIVSIINEEVEDADTRQRIAERLSKAAL